MSDYDKFAKEYSDSHGEEGDYFHKTQIDPYIYKIIGNPKGKVIYDLGCGNGYISRKLAKEGAKVYASDLSKELINIAKEKSKAFNNIDFQVRDATDFSGLKKRNFDVVVINMVIHYVIDLDKLFSGISKLLKSNGKVAISTSHFFRPDFPYSEWVLGKVENKEKLFIKVTNYLKSYKVKVKSFWDNKTIMNVVNRPLGDYVNTMSKYNLYLQNVYEPESVGFAQKFSKGLQKSHHIPTFIIFGAIKKD